MLNTRLNTLRESLIPLLRDAASAAGLHAWQVEDGGSSLKQRAAGASDERLQAALTFSGALSGVLVLSIRRTDAALLFGEDGKGSEGWPALVLSIGERLCPALTDAIGAVALQGCRVPDANLPLQQLLPVVVLRSDGEHTVVEIDISADDTLQGQLRLPTRVDDASPQATPLHRVIDVPLAVKLRFGQRHLTLREVLELKTGSLLELDRQVEEAVDLMLGERVIARGEVVIIDGNYGMRITEVLETPGGAAGRQNPPPLRYATA